MYVLAKVWERPDVAKRAVWLESPLILVYPVSHWVMYIFYFPKSVPSHISASVAQ